MSFKIVADSSINICHKKEVDFVTVPLKINAGDREFVDDENLNLEEMVEYLKTYKGKSTTSCPNYGEWEAEFKDADEIFAITISSNLSGSYNAANLAAQDFPEKKIHVIDSLGTGGGMMLAALKIRECEAKGMNFDETAKFVDDYLKNQTNLIFTLEAMDNLANNGRVNALVAKGAEFFGIRLIGKASEEGRIEMMDKAKGKARSVEKSYEAMKKLGFKGIRVVVDHVMNPEIVEKLKEKILADYPNCEIIIGECGGLCSFYAEHGGFIAGFE